MTKAKFAAKAGAGRAAWGVSALPPSHRLWPKACRQTVPQPAGPSLDPTLLAQTGPGSAHLHLCSANPSCKPPGLGTSLCTVWDRGVCAPFSAFGGRLEYAMDDPWSPPNPSIFCEVKRQHLSQQGLSQWQHVLPWAVREHKSEFGGRDSAAAARPAVTNAESESSSHCRNLPGLRGGHEERGEPSMDVPCLGMGGCCCGTSGTLQGSGMQRGEAGARCCSALAPCPDDGT